MKNLAEIHLKAETLARYELPDIPYPIPTSELHAALSGDGELPFAAMLYGLQQRSRDGKADWKELEPAMERLAGLLAPDDPREIVTAAGGEWWLEIGPVDLARDKLVTIQRGDDLIAAITPRDDGRLRIAVFRPLDAKSARYLMGLALKPHPVHGVCMRENNWEYARDSSAGNGNSYADERGEAYLSRWEQGLGISWSNTEIPEWRRQTTLIARPPSRVATELGVQYVLSDDGTVASDAEDPAENESQPRR